MRKLCAYFIVPYLIAIAKGSFKQIMKRKVTSKADCNFKLTPFDCLLSIVQVMSATNAHLVGVPILQALPKNVFSRQNRKLKSANWTRSARVSMQLFHTQKTTKKIKIIWMLLKREMEQLRLLYDHVTELLNFITTATGIPFRLKFP